MNPQLPKIRTVDPQPIFHQGQPSLYLRDPLQLNGHALVLPQVLGPLLFLCNGTRGLPVIARIMQTHFGVRVGEAQLAQFMEAFDEVYLLDNARSRAAQHRALDDYRHAPFRPPASAGLSYPADPAELHRLLQDYLERAEVQPDTEGGRALLSPHIDYPRGGSVYAQVWKRAAHMLQQADLFIIIGTDHHNSRDPITLTRQNYATPSGVLPTSQSVVNALAQAIGEDAAFAGELYHRQEHSLELPLVWLHYLVGMRPVEVVPILAGNLTPGDPLIPRVVDALHQAAASRKAFFVISGDLAHVGPAFGGEPLSLATNDIGRADEALLGRLAAGDAEGFLDSILRGENANNVCGTYPLYLALRALGNFSGERAGYAQCPADEAGTSLVSVAGMVFN